MAHATAYETNYGDSLSSSTNVYGGDYPPTSPVSGGSSSTGSSQQTTQPASSSSEQLGSNIDWNGLFQHMLESPDDTKDARLKKHENISTLNDNFVSMAKQLGKLIIAEHFLPDSVKTIKPYNLAGIAGGKKYLYNGILFKLQTDWKGIYGSDHNAMKSGSLELKGLMRYYGFHKIHVPLMAIIDYRGYRLLAEARLPISPASLHYGSADGGFTVKDGSSCPELQELMKTVGMTLNLAGHWCGPKDQQTFLYGPIDVEGHKGTDGRFYVIDLARVFPPTAEAGVTKTFLYQAFRPEFVRRYREPLSSDAFAKFVAFSPDASEHNERVKLATAYLLEKVVPEFAQWLDNNPQALRDGHQLSDLTELAHREGINVRYLGLVRHQLRSQSLRRFALMELIARVIKNKLNLDLRTAGKGKGNQEKRGDENYLPIVLDFFNLVLGENRISEDWWCNKLKDQLYASYKVECLSLEERAHAFSLRPLVDLHALFKRVQTLTGVRFTKIVMEQLKSSKSFELVSVDIRKMGVRVKHMNITSQSQGSALAIQAITAMTNRIETLQIAKRLRGNAFANSPELAAHSDVSFGYDRLFNLSMMKYEQAIRATPDNKTMLTHYASVLIRVALLKSNLNEPATTYFEKAFQKLESCENTTALLQLGELLQHLRGFWSETSEIYSLACKCYEVVSKLDPNFALTWTAWADTLLAQARSSHDAHLYTLAGSKYRISLRLSPLPGVEWLTSCHQTLSDAEVATAVELVGRRKQRRFDSIFPILESTPTGEPIQVNDTEQRQYSALVEAVSDPTDECGSSIHIDESGSVALTSGLLTLASPSPSLVLSPSPSQSSNAACPGGSPLLHQPQPHTPAAELHVGTIMNRSIDASLAFNRSYISPGLIDSITASFPDLRSLRLSGCNPLPLRLPQSVPYLTELNIANTEASDRWLASVVSVPTLARLDITNCQKLTHVALKDVMTKCTALTHFYASYMGACKDPKLEPQIGFVSSTIQTLHLAGFRPNSESWCRLIACSNLSSLRKLALDECLEVNDAVLTALGQSCPLTHISLRGCISVTNAGVEALVTAHLKHKSHTSKSSPPTPESSTRAKALIYFDLTDCNMLTMHTLDILATHLTTLESLLINGVNLFESTTTWLGAPLRGSDSSDVALKSSNSSSMRVSTEKSRLANAFHRLIENNPKLSRLELAHTGVGDVHLEQLASGASSIIQLKIVSDAVTDVGLHAISKPGLMLQLLDLEHTSITDVGLIEIVKACGQTLTAISLSGCSDLRLTEEGLIQLANSCSNLHHLDVSHSSVATDKGVAAVAEHCRKLQRLSLVGCRFLTDLTIEALAEHAHKLHFLNMSRCPCIISLGPLGEGCPELRELHVRGCEFVSDDTPGFGKLANLRALRYLDLQGCHYITDVTLGMLETDACPDLQVLVLGRNKIRDTHVQSLRIARRSLIIHNVSDQPLQTNAMPRQTSLNNSGSVLSESAELGPQGVIPTTPRTSATHLRGSLSVTGTPSGVATKTLMNDLKSILKNPVPYVSAQPVDDSSLYVWHGNLLGPENTPYAGAVFHIELVFPQDYPTNPPSATLFTPLPHPHVHKDHICLDILSDYKGYFSAIQELEGKDTTDLSGWHSSYTVQSILLSMQSFLMDMKENAHGTELRELMIRIPDSIRTAANFSCPRCAHRPGTPWPPISTEVPQVSMSEKEIIAEELRCEHTRAPFTEDVLGICVEVTQRRSNGSIMNVSYAMQLLAHKAFENGVRSGGHSGEKYVFMPLWINEEHGARAMPIAEESVAQLYTGNPGAIFQPTMALDVLSQLMKCMVVDLVKSKASINALQYYFAAHRLLIAFAKKYPVIVQTADKIVTKFSENPAYRSKREVPDLGCLLMLLTITNMSWRDVANAYMQESFVRNAPRAIEKSPELASTMPDARVDSLRNEKTFLATRVSLGITMLQVYFLDHIGRPKGVSLQQVAVNYDSLYGRLTVKIREDFLEAIKGINSINNWSDTFKFLGLPPKPSEEITSWLRDCVQLSIRAGYCSNLKRNESFNLHGTPPNSKSNTKGNSGGMNRSGSAKFNSRQGADLAPPSSHSTGNTPKRPRSRGSSNSSSSDTHALDEFDLAEFDSALSLSTSSLPSTRTGTPATNMNLSSSSAIRPTAAWTGSNPVLDKHAKKDHIHDRHQRHGESAPNLRSNAPSGPAAPSSPNLQIAVSNPITPSIQLEPEEDDDNWITTGRPRKKSKPQSQMPPVTSPVHGTPGRGFGRGQGSRHYHSNRPPSSTPGHGPQPTQPPQKS